MPRHKRELGPPEANIPLDVCTHFDPQASEPLAIWLQLDSSFRGAARQLERLLSAERLSSTSFTVLAHLPREPDGIPAMQLSQITGNSPSSVSELLKRMEREGLCSRRPDPRDGRGAMIHISAAGSETLLRAAKIYADWLLSHLGQLTNTELRTLQRAAIILGNLHAID